MRVTSILGAVGVAVAIAVMAPRAVAAAEGPTVKVDRASASPGDRVIVTTEGFESDMFSVAVCGNLARRGSSDCNMQASQSDGRDRFHAVTLSLLVVQAPPVPCPCVIRVASPSQRELAVAPIEIVGHPVAAVVGVPYGPLVELTVEARRAPKGFVASVRASLGGPTRYVVTVSVRNLTSEALENLTLAGSASNRLDDELVALELSRPVSLEPGHTWQEVVEVEVPAPALGRYAWEVTASGAGASVVTVDSVGTTPWALLVVVVGLVVDLGAIARRRWTRRPRLAASDPLEAATPRRGAPKAIAS